MNENLFWTIVAAILFVLVGIPILIYLFGFVLCCLVETLDAFLTIIGAIFSAIKNWRATCKLIVSPSKWSAGIKIPVVILALGLLYMVIILSL